MLLSIRGQPGSAGTPTEMEVPRPEGTGTGVAQVPPGLVWKGKGKGKKKGKGKGKGKGCEVGSGLCCPHSLQHWDFAAAASISGRGGHSFTVHV